jgi:hypothetical protein
MGTTTSLPFIVKNNGILIDTHGLNITGPDTIIEIE